MRNKSARRVVYMYVTYKADMNEFDARVRRALVEENVGLRDSRRSQIEWRALQALIDAAGSLAPAA